jgi:hypothetical protein
VLAGAGRTLLQLNEPGDHSGESLIVFALIFESATMEQPAPELKAVALLADYLDVLLSDHADELNESADKRVAFFVFVFGGVIGLAVQQGFEPPQAHSLALELFRSALRLTPMEASRMAQFGIDAAAGDSPWSYAAEEGLEEFFAWRADPAGFRISRLRSVLDRAPARMG